MTQQPSDDDAAERARKIAEVFGEVLPETTSDERDLEPGADEPSREAWLRDQVPPHH